MSVNRGIDPGAEIADEVSYDLFGQTLGEPTSAVTDAKPSRDERNQRIRVLVLVKAYPALSTKYGEVVCVAGVRTDGERPEWVRLWPVSFRALEFTDQFSKYQQIDVDVFRPASDRRPESWSPKLPTLTLGATLSTSQRWQARRDVIEPLVVESMCWLQGQQATARTSLGVFRPAVVQDFEVTSADDADLIAASIRRRRRRSRLFSAPNVARSSLRRTNTSTTTSVRTIVAAATTRRSSTGRPSRPHGGGDPSTTKPRYGRSFATNGWECCAPLTGTRCSTSAICTRTRSRSLSWVCSGLRAWPPPLRRRHCSTESDERSRQARLASHRLFEDDAAVASVDFGFEAQHCDPLGSGKFG